MLVKTESRICFGIEFYDSEQEAQERSAQGTGSYNGGWRHGSPTGRDPSHDHVDPKTGIKLYAVTTS